MIRFERVERIGGVRGGGGLVWKADGGGGEAARKGRENFSEEKFSLPSPNPTSPFPKTFDFIESLFAGFWG